jgi:exonuclease SbcD
MMRLIHLADVHLGMENFGSYDSVTGVHSRVMEYLDALDCIVDVARISDPDLIIFAGDAFKTRTPNPTLVTQFAYRIQALANIAPVFMVLGNHDRQRTGSERRHSVSLMEDLAARYQIVVADSVHAYHAGCAWLVSLPWLYDVTLDDVCDVLDIELSKISDDDLPVILIGHCMVEGCVLDSGYSVGLDEGELIIPRELLCDPDLWDYVALGHVHKHQVICSQPPVLYSGSIERVNWGERDGKKGFIIADIDNTDTSWRFVDIQAAPMKDLSLSYKDLNKLAGMNLEDAIVRLSVNTFGKMDTSKAYRAAADALAKSGCRIDAINVITPEIERTKLQSRHAESMTTMDLLDAYFDSIGVDPKRRVVLKKAAKLLMDNGD